MNSSPRMPLDGPGPDLPRLLCWAGGALMGLFLLGVVASLLPLALASPAWQLQQVQSFVQQGPMALIGLSLLGVGCHLSSWEIPERRLALLRRSALIVAIGYVLLIPLQVFASWSQWNQAASRELVGRNRLRTQLETLDRQVALVTDDAQLQALLSRLPVTAPRLEQLGPDLQTRRKSAQALVSRLSDGVSLELRRREDRRRELVLRSSLRNCLAALLFSVAWLMVARHILPVTPLSRPKAPGPLQRRRKQSLEDLFDASQPPEETPPSGATPPSGTHPPGG